jgi:hypothetical protein
VEYFVDECVRNDFRVPTVSAAQHLCEPRLPLRMSAALLDIRFKVLPKHVLRKLMPTTKIAKRLENNSMPVLFKAQNGLVVLHVKT